MSGAPRPVGMVLSGGELLLGPGGLEVVAWALRRVSGGGGLPAAAEHLRGLVVEGQRRQGLPMTAEVGNSEAAFGGAGGSSVPVDPVTSMEVARMLGRSERTATGWCRGGLFGSAVKVGGVWLVERAEVVRVRDERGAA